MKQFQKNCNSLIQCFYDLPKIFDETDEPLELLQFMHETKYSRSYFMHYVRLNKNDTLYIYSNAPYYFYPDQFDDLDDKLKENKSDWSTIKLYPINQIFDIDKYCNDNYKESKVFTKPTLYFGYSILSGLKQVQFISKITHASEDAINFVDNLYVELKAMHINDNTFRTPSEIMSEIQSLSYYFHALYSDSSKCDDINAFLPKMKSIFTQLDSYINAVDYELRYKVESMWKASYSRFVLKPVFDDGYKLPIPNFKQFNHTKQVFKIIKNTNFISNPILSVENGSIVCCYTSLSCNLGPFIPSLYSQRFAINFISFIDESFTIKIETDPNHKKLFSSENFSKGGLAQIKFSLPDVSSEKPEKHKISAKIIFESKNYNKLILPLNLYIQVIPLSLLISCKQSQLSCKNNMFYVCKDRFLPYSKLSFSINNFYLDEKIVVKHQFINLEGNEISKPKIDRLYNDFELQIPSTKSVKRLHAELKMKFSDKFSTSILIDAVVIPFDFDFEVYDPNEKKFNKKATIYYTPKSINKKIKLHFRIFCPTLIEELEGEIKDEFPFEIQAQIPNKFHIKSNKEFDVDLRITRPLKSKSSSSYYYYYKEPQDPSYNLTVKINGIAKQIPLKFSQLDEQIIVKNHINAMYLTNFNVYAYKDSDKKWYHIQNSADTIGCSCFISPFSNYKQSQLRVTYFLGCKVDAVNCSFILINEDGESITKESNEAKIEKKDGGFMRALKWIVNKNSDLIPIFGVSGNIWFPVFDTYKPDMKWDLLEIHDKNSKVNDKNIEIAKQHIKNVDDVYRHTINPTHFYTLFKLLKQGKVIKNLKNFIQPLPINIKNSFDDIIARAEILESNDPLMIILSHNAIILFKKHFEERYKEIVKNNNCASFCSLTQTEIDQQVDKCFNEYYTIDQKENILTSLNYQKYKNIDSKVTGIQLELKPEQRSHAFLYTEKSSPNPKPLNTKPEYISSNNSGISYSSANDIKFELPSLTAQYDDDNQLTIPKLNDIYLSAINGARLLPIFVSNMKTQKSIKEANDYFYNLLDMYKNLPVKDFSFISKTTNLFIESFTSMIGKFKKAGVDFGSILPPKCIVSDVNIQDFFQYPERDEFTIPADQWNDPSYPVHEPNISPVPNPTPAIQVDSASSDNESKTDDNLSSDNNDDDDDDYKSKSSSAKQRQTNPKENKQIKLINIVNKMKEDLSENQGQDDDDIVVINDNDDDDDDIQGPSSNVYVTSNNNNIEDQHMSLEEMDGMLSKFTDENGIKRAISRMKAFKSMEVKPFLNVNTPEPLEINPSFFDTTKDNFPISELIPQGFYLANKFIKEAFDMNIQRSKFAVNILVDCSSFISYENKIFNMMIICALTTALESLEIPYSAAVIADKDFKCVVKSFKEPHSTKCLQKILDCLLIKRYRTKLASSINYAIRTMSFDDDQKSENKRPYRAIFAFSDGLDEQLVLTNAWSKCILAGKADDKDEFLTKESLSFGFIFIESSKLVDNDKSFIEKIWKDLENECNKNKPIPILNIAPIKLGINDEVTGKLIRLFEIVMKRAINTEEKLSEHSKSSEGKQRKETLYPEATFSIDEKLSSIKRFSTFIGSDYQEIKGIYTTSTQVLKNASSTIDKLNPLKYRNKLKKIATCEIDDSLKKEEYFNFMKHFIINKRRINQASLEAVLKPNKASQMVLSTTGTDFDITALVLNLINPVPDPMIYLEEKGGLIRNYGISIVVDPSVSCFDELSGPHSFQTLQTILSSLVTLDISCFDLIVAGNPHPKVVCSEVGTIHALSSKSSLYSSLFAVLQNPIHNTDLSSAIHMAFDLRRMRSSEHTSLLFVLTNGLYDDKECERIVNSVNVCVQSGITTFGVGIGNYPKGIEKIFPQAVFSLNPANVMKAIASFYGDSISSLLPEMTPINFVPPKNADLISTITKLIENEKNPIFNSLKDTLKNIMPTLDAFDDMYNEEQNIGDAIKGYTNPVGVNTELYIKDLLKTQKILIVMLWDYTLNEKNEEHYVHPDYIEKPSENGAGCIKTAVEHFGIELKIVRNYKDAINELTQKTDNGFCEYYATWVFCGPPYEILPEDDADPNLVGQFNEVLILFWENGGSIVFWAEGDPLHYQVNLFLEEVEFKKEKDCPSGKVSFRIGGDHRGTNILLGEESDILKRKQTFNRMKRINKKVQRSILSHNIGKIYEGISISYAPYDLNAIKPFKPFSRDSEGGISSLFYEANLKTGTGDIIIDCGYTKCFTKMSTDGTFRYVQNIAGWTARPEVHKVIDGVEPSEWRPKAVEFKLQEGVIWNRFDILPVNPKNLKTLWAIDASDSIRNNQLYHTELKKIVDEYYKDDDEIYLWSDTIEKISFDRLKTFMSNREGRKAGTRSSLIADIASQSGIHQHLLIVTDGSVDLGEVDESDRKFNRRFKFVTTFIIQDEFDPTTRENLNDPNTRNQISQQVLDELRLKPDLSVGAPYSRRCQNITYYIKGYGAPKIEMASLKSEDINALNNIDNINSYDAFIKEYDKLDHAIQASTLGTTKNSNLLEKLEKLKKRVKESGLDSQQNKDFDDKFEVLYRMASGGLRNAFKLEDIAAAKQGTVK